MRGSVSYSGAGDVKGQGRHNSRSSTEAAEALQVTAASTRGRADASSREMREEQHGGAE